MLFSCPLFSEESFRRQVCMKTTRIPELLGTQYPILQGGMLWLADAGLAAAVSNAGGLGVISPMAGMEPDGDPVENLTIQITKAKELTTKPVGVNVPLDLRDSELLMDVIFALEIPVVVTAAGDPRLYTELFHAQDAKVIHVLSSVKHAQVAEAAGVERRNRPSDEPVREMSAPGQR